MVFWSCSKPQNITLPEHFSAYIDHITFTSLGKHSPEIKVKEVSQNMVRVSLEYQLTDTVKQDDWQITITPSFQPDFHWAPHLTPTRDHIISQHVFRAPALIVADNEKKLVVLPDIGTLTDVSPVEWYMDLDAPNNNLTLGMSRYEVKEHVLFVRDTGAVYPPGKLEFSFYLIISNEESDIQNPWRDILAFYWDNWGSELFKSGDPIEGDIEPFVEYTYQWAFDTWKEPVWQEFRLNNRKVGAPVFIVNVTQSPNYPGHVNEREFRSIWNQAWFSSLRSASGLYRYARRTGNEDLLEKARLGKELALAFPQRKGFFDGLIATEMEKVEINGEQYNRSKGWDTFYFGNSNRNPVTRDPGKSPLHILDMSWTAYLMLVWYDELEKDDRLVAYAKNYANSLLEIQGPDGFFPSWLDKNSLEPMDVLAKSPETSMSVTFLMKLADLIGDNTYYEAAIRAMDAVADNIIPIGKWEDFETYWSCSRYGADELVGNKVVRNNMFKQNTLSMYWTAEALLETYKVTANERYLQLGQRTLDELLMYQAAWQPPFMHVKTLGGFGVMNADGEWNDSRQCLFAELIIDYGKELGIEEYIERGVAALESSFAMMYCPENPRTKVQWEKKYDFFSKEDYGFMMENYGHGGYTSKDGIGIGVFTIYDWGNGAASEAYNRIVDHYDKEVFSQN